MKIVCVDGYDRDGPLGNDSLVCDNVNKYYRQRIVKWLRGGCSDVVMQIGLN